MKTRIIQDHPLAHEDVMVAWTHGERCVVVPHGFENPRAYVEAHPGGPGMFIYMANANGGYDLTHVTWQQFQKRMEGRTMLPFATRVMSMFDNRWGYGLALGRLYTVYHGGVVIPYRGSPRRAVREIAEQGVETVYCIASVLAGGVNGNQAGSSALKTIINVCWPLDLEAVATLAGHFPGAQIRNLFGLGRCGIIALSDGRELEPGEQGDLVVPAELRDGELFVQSASTYPDYDIGDGWCATGKRARIDGMRLFIDGDVGAQ